MSNFAKMFFLVLLSFRVYADGVPFSVSAALPDNAEAETKLIAQLKMQAISDWLQGYLGARYAGFEKHLTGDFAEKYVLAYSVSRTSTTPPNLVVNGQLDADALKRWIRVAEGKQKGGNQQRAMLFMSSSVPGLTFSASETASKVKEITIANTLYSLIGPHFSHVGTKVSLAETGPSISPKLQTEVSRLRDYFQGAGAAVWVDFSPVSGSSGTVRVDIFGYNPDRLLFAVSDDIAIAAHDFSNPEYLKTALAGVAQSFRPEWESVVSDGRLNSADFRVVHEGLNSYRDMKVFEAALSRQDFANQVVLKRAANRTVEFEFGTALNSEEVAERLGALQPGNRPLKVTKIDSRTIVVK